ncbi:DUF4367 domain-containing protein [Halobacterium jilantaiense]|uniref:Outer membrane lipoprotein-sorting protein n=1 Tax=Halobacterium jilantaiense TaxID=355548 RepID=A0A1I0N6Q0_9EURY|nr:DUF4367 domain-containing protein [Halobacterium jilantaiense]SEV96520.1 Outer membrane lipoprotein-sorting protein [Halobacterium jilantaiense]
MALKRFPVVLGVVVVLLVASLAGCVGLEDSSTAQETTTAAPQTTAGESPSADVIEQHALSNNTSVESVTGTVTITTGTGNGTQTMEANVWQVPPNDVRYEYVSGPSEGTLLVSNESTFWMYNETTNTARRFQYDTGLAENLTRAFQNLSSEFTAEYQREETVSGRETYVVSVQPPNGTLGSVASNQTVWLDQENWFPVRTQVTTTVGNQTSTSTITYSNLTYNATIPADRFTFEPPTNATVENVTLPETRTFESVDAAAASVNFSVREPTTLPDGFALQNVTTTQSGATTAVSLTYANESSTLRVSQSTATGSATQGENVSVAGYDGSYVEFGERGILQWRTDRFTYSVSGPFSRSTLVAVAESLHE